jgi:tRNA(fMet)-specific endonuclease VapC
MALYVLDTDTLTLYRRGHPLVEPRVKAQPPGTVVPTVISAEEQLTGWYSLLRRVKRPDQLEHAYRRLADVVEFFAGCTILPMDRAAIARYTRLTAMKLNVKKMDLRIAAIALEYNATVVTRNVRDFGRVPGLAVADWSAP